MNSRWRIGLSWISRLILAGTFLVSGGIKLADLAQTQLAVSGYHLLPDVLIWPASLFLPWLEIVGALGLLASPTLHAARGMLSVLLVTFLLAILATWARGLDITCGCFGGTGIANYPWLVTRDLLLLGLVWFANPNALKRTVNKHVC